MGLCANMKYTLVEIYLLFSAACMVNWFGEYFLATKAKGFVIEGPGNQQNLLSVWIAEESSSISDPLRSFLMGHGGRLVSMRLCSNPNEFGLSHWLISNDLMTNATFYCGSWRKGPQYCGGGFVHWGDLAGSRVGAHCYGSLQVPILRYNCNLWNLILVIGQCEDIW